MIRRPKAAHLRLVSANCGAPDPCASCEARGLAVCGALAMPQLDRMAAALDTVIAAPGETLAEEGEAASHVFTITSGSVRLYKLMPDGRRQIVGFLHPGDLLGLSASPRHGATAEAIDTVTACRFPRSDYQRILAETPALQSALLKRAAEKLAAAHEHVLLRGRKSAPERVASFLLDIALASRSGGGNGIDLSLPMTRGEIADYLGLTTETVSRTISRFKADGLIALAGLHGVRLLRPAELLSLASGA